MFIIPPLFLALQEGYLFFILEVFFFCTLSNDIRSFFSIQSHEDWKVYQVLMVLLYSALAFISLWGMEKAVDLMTFRMLEMGHTFIVFLAAIMFKFWPSLVSFLLLRFLLVYGLGQCLRELQEPKKVALA